MKMPLFISVPHAGTHIPAEVRDMCLLHRQDIHADCDAEASFIYGTLEKYALGFCTTDIVRSVVDLNRAPDVIGNDGVIKSHTCWNVPVYRKMPDKKLMKVLLDRYYFPYHGKLSAGGKNPAIRLGIDCHTMSAVGPPVGPDPGRERPLVCVSNADGTCPQEWITSLAHCLSKTFRGKVTINTPFQGGYITRKHSSEMFWLQVEISQTETYSLEIKKNCLLEGLQRFCHMVF